MNKEAIKDLIEFLEHLEPEKFDMAHWFRRTECGSVACVAGWTCWLDEDLRFLTELQGGGGVVISDAAQKKLGLNDYQASELFEPGFATRSFEPNRTPRQAAAVLRHFLDTGVVDWDMCDAEAGHD